MSEPLQPPPADLDAEESVLGAMLVSASVIAGVAELLEPADFYRQSHGTIYAAILAIHGRGETPDSITVIDELERRHQLDQVGGKPGVHTLASAVPAVSNTPHYARIVAE